MGRPKLATPDRYGEQSKRLAGRDEVERLVAEWTGSMERHRLMEICLAHEVPAGPLNTIADIFADPHFEARGNLEEVNEGGLGPVVVPSVLPRLSETPGAIETLGPALGNATDEVLASLLGLGEADLARLREAKVI
jgi:crotonobetainyl-CoA:carnitine CoA-transferase CaiB-like acyl-CoA transferase